MLTSTLYKLRPILNLSDWKRTSSPHPHASTKPFFFLIASPGINASRWLAKTLNSHPDIVCTHGAAEFEFALDHDYKDDGSLSDEKRARRRMQSAARKSLSLDDIFSELKSVRPARAYGNVHMFTVQELDHILRRQTDTSNAPFQLRYMNLIRHPIARISSWVAMTTQLWQTRFTPTGELSPSLPDFLQQAADNHIKATNQFLEQERLGALHKPHRAFNRDSFPDILRLYALKENLALALLHRRYPHIYSVTKERLTTDPDYFGLFLTSMFDHEMASPQFVDCAVKADAFNVRRDACEKDANPLSPKKDFLGWPEWQRELFSMLSKRHGLPDIYAAKGYDFSFLE